MILIIVSVVLIGPSLALNSSFCCHEEDDIWVNDDDLNYCLDLRTNATTKIILKCPDNMTFVASNETLEYKLKQDGSLGIWIGEMSEVASVQTGEFCLGHQGESELVIICQSEMEPELVSQEVLGYCMAVSSVFLTLTTFVYIAFPELRNLQGKSIVSLCSTQATANALFCVMKVMVYSHMTWCAIRGFLAYYFNISSFFWMNAIAVQVLINMKHPSTTNGNGGWKKFIWYALYAWGTPAILTTILIIANYHPGPHTRPGIGYSHCWFLDTKSIWIYMYSVLSILMTANVAIFVHASVSLWKQTFASSHLKALRHKSWMMFKLFIIMGLPWIFEMVSSLTPAHTFWVILDIINCLQGLIVFLVLVVFRRRVLKALNKRKLLFCVSGVAKSCLEGDSDEEEIVTPTVGVPMEETGRTRDVVCRQGAALG